MGSRPESLLYEYIHQKNNFKGVREFWSLWENPGFVLTVQVCWKRELGRRRGEERHSSTCGARNTASSGRPGPPAAP